MKYELIGENDVQNLFDTVLSNRGVVGERAISLLLNPSEETLISPFNLKNIEEGIGLLLQHIERESKILVVVDSDMDGYTSATVAIDFLQNILKQDVDYYIHATKSHGIDKNIIDKALNEGYNLVIMPDASSNDFVAHKTLKDNGVDVLVLDHHEIELNSQAIADGLCSIEGESHNAVVVNPLLSPDYPNKQISGVGVTYKFVQAFCEYCELPNYYSKYLDLVAMGNVADMMDLRTPETRYLVYEGLKRANLQNPLLKAMVKEYSGANTIMTPERVSWDIAPKVNGMIRVGKPEEKQRMLEAFLGVDYEVKRTWRDKEYIETLPECVAREAKNAHARGKKLKSKIAEEALEVASNMGIEDKNILIIPMKDLPSGMGGIVAQEVSSKVKKPVSIVTETKSGDYAGSVRGYDPAHTNTKSLFENSKLVNFARGHGQAHGVSFPQNNYNSLIELISNELEQGESILPVDFILSSKSISLSLVKRVDSYSHYFGRGIEKPKFVFENVEVTKGIADFKANSMSIDFNGVQIIAFKKDEELEELIEGNNKVTVNIVGSMGMGQWRGRAKAQLAVDSIEIVEAKPYDASSVKKGFGYVVF